MSNTLLPFLYQTPTLQRVARAGSRAPVGRVLFHSSVLRRKAKYTQKDAIPFELPPDWDDAGPREKEQGTITPKEREAFDRIFEEIAARGKAPIVPSDSKMAAKATAAKPAAAKPAAAKSAAAKSAGSIPQAGGEETVTSFLDARKKLLDEKFSFIIPKDEVNEQKEPEPKAGHEAINIIIRNAADLQYAKRQERNTEARGIQPLDSLHPLQTVTGAKDRAQALLRFPPSLRQAAAIAMGVVEPGPTATANVEPAPPPSPPLMTADTGGDSGAEDPIAPAVLDNDLARLGSDLEFDKLGRNVANDLARKKEGQRIQTLMAKAKTDFELWDIMEREVFSMVDKLGLKDAQTNSNKSKNKGRKKTDDTALSLNVHGPLYPEYLLSGLQILDRKFARSSPLALNVLPRIKELGLVSYLLGVSTSFYNELAGIYWYRYGDAKAVFNLMDEMRYAGLYQDENTKSIIWNIDRDLNSWTDQFGHIELMPGEPPARHPFLSRLLRLPEYKEGLFPRISHWSNTSSISLLERRRALGY